MSEGWEAFAEGFAAGIAPGALLGQRHAAGKRRQQVVDDDLKTAALNRKIAEASEARQVDAAARTEELHPIAVEQARAGVADTKARTGASVARTAALGQSMALADRQETERKETNQATRALLANKVGTGQNVDNRGEAPTAPPAVGPVASGEEYAAHLLSVREATTQESIHEALNPGVPMALHSDRERIRTLLENDKIDPAVAAAHVQQLENDLLQGYDQVAAQIATASANGDMQKVANLVTQAGMYHPDRDQQLVARPVEGGVQIAEVNRGTDKDDIGWSGTIPQEGIGDAITHWRNQIFEDMSLEDSKVHEAGKVATAATAKVELDKKMAEINKLYSEAYENMASTEGVKNAKDSEVRNAVKLLAEFSMGAGLEQEGELRALGVFMDAQGAGLIKEGKGQAAMANILQQMYAEQQQQQALPR